MLSYHSAAGVQRPGIAIRAELRAQNAIVFPGPQASGIAARARPGQRLVGRRG